MFVVHSSNRLERLASQLADWLQSDTDSSPLQPQTVIVQSNGMARWLSLQVASANGIAANIEFPFPASFVWKIYRQALGDRLPEQSPYNADRVVWTLLDVLPEMLGYDGFESVRHYFDETDARSQFDLATRIADIFDQYLVFRPDWIAQWEAGQDSHWQAQLWRRLHQALGDDHRAALQNELFAELEKGVPLSQLPPRIAIFGIPSLPPGVLETFRRLAGSHCEVHIFMLAPCQEYWGDIVEDRQTRLLGDDYLEVGNNLLAATGKQGKEFFDMLLAESVAGESESRDDYVDAIPAGLAESEAPLLQQLQQDILRLEQYGRDGKGVATLSSDDYSLQLHSCHSGLREMQVLHDQLLALFNNDLTLQPADVCVLSPVLDDYAPYIDAVFGSLANDDPRFIPFTIADQQRRDSEQLAEALTAALELAGGRFEVDRVVDLLENEAVSRQFELSIDDCSVLRGWLADTGIAWGLDATHRGKQGVPPTDIGTWATGLRRLWLGYALGTDCAGSEPPLFYGSGDKVAAPFVGLEGHSIAILGRLQAFVDLLEGWQQRVSGEQSVAEWVAFVSGAMDKLLAPEQAESLVSLRESLAKIADCAGGYSKPVPLSVVLDSWQTQRAGAEGGSGFLAGAVTFASMVPMRSLPFRVLCLVGLNGGVYPRVIRPPEFDLMAHDFRAGDRSRRNDDRYLFLEALLSARETLYLSYVGQSQRDDTAIPPSVVVSELIDSIDLGWQTDEAEPRVASAQLLVKHPLQPFSERYFNSTEPSLFSYRREWLEALIQPKSLVKPFWSGALADGDSQEDAGGDDGLLQLDVADLLSMASKPARKLLRRLAKLRLPELDEQLSSRELLLPDGLENWQLREALLADNDIGDGIDSAESEELVIDQLIAAGKLPPAPVGPMIFNNLSNALASQLSKRNSLTAGVEPLPPLELKLSLPGAVIHGQLNDLHREGMIVCTASKIGYERKLDLWLRHLLLCAAGPSGIAPKSYLLARERWVELPPISADTAKAELATWMEAWHALHEGPVLLNAEMGYFHNKQSGSKAPEDRLSEAAAGDAATRQLYGPAPAFDMAAQVWAERLYGPWVENMGGEKIYE